MSDDEFKEEKELDLTSPEVVTKYKSAAEIINKALQLVLSECKPKAKIVDLCEKGDSFIREQTGSMYKNVKKKIERGIAFPTCISVNNTICHFSPLASDESVLEAGDILKIDMGCHIDGFIAVVGHTHVLQEGPVTGRAADVIAAANTAAEVALRLVRPGRKNKDVTEAIQKVAAAYDCKIVEGVLSHQLKQFVIDGNKVILSVANPETKVDDAEFEENEVYAVDIVTSTGDGKPKLLDEKQTTIYKRAVDKSYHLKMKASRFIFSEINQNFPIMPFTARALEEKRARLGLVECVNHDLLQPYPVLHEKPGDLVAHVKFTVLLMPNGSDRITPHALQELQPTKTVDDPEIKAWLSLGTKKKKGGGKKKENSTMATSASNRGSSNRCQDQATVDEASGSSRPKRKQRWIVLSNFEKVQNEQGNYIAICHHCKERFTAACGTSNLINHLQRCKARQDVLSQQVVATKKDEGTPSCRNSKFNQERSRGDVTKMIVKYEYPFCMVDHEYFREFVHNLQPSFELRHRITVSSDIMKLYNEERQKLYSVFARLSSRISFTTDLWTAPNTRDSYLCLTGHFIDDDWVLRKIILNFRLMESVHSGDEMSKVVLKCLYEWNIDKKMLSITLLNASANDSMIAKLKGILSPYLIDVELFHTRFKKALSKRASERLMHTTLQSCAFSRFLSPYASAL